MCHSRSRARHEDAAERDPGKARRHFNAQAQKFGTVMAICLGIWLLSGAGSFWPAWVLLFCGIRLATLARNTFGRADDLAYDEV